MAAFPRTPNDIADSIKPLKFSIYVKASNQSVPQNNQEFLNDDDKFGHNKLDIWFSRRSGFMDGQPHISTSFVNNIWSDGIKISNNQIGLPSGVIESLIMHIAHRTTALDNIDTPGVYIPDGNKFIAESGGSAYVELIADYVAA